MTSKPARPMANTNSPAGERERLLGEQARQQQRKAAMGGYGTKDTKEVAKEQEDKDDSNSILIMAFLSMLVIGTGNRIFMRLQTYPMYNYPFFLSTFTTFIYVPVCFMYILPMQLFGTSITPEQTRIPKYNFAVMGFLDALAGIMSVFACNYIAQASMIVLLQQAAIPFSMVISKMFLGARYTQAQYIGATVVIAGIIFSLIPTFLGGSSSSSGSSAGVDNGVQALWSIIQVLSCIPMCLSSVYKEKALGEADIDVIYLNGWVAIYQFVSSLLFAVPSAYTMGLTLEELPSNTIDGLWCMLGVNSVTPTMVEGSELSSISVDHCEMAPWFVSMYLIFNIMYNIILIVILKHGSANVLWLASTVMVPIGNVAFSLKVIPGHQPLRTADVAGLVIILSGLLIYRCSGAITRLFAALVGGKPTDEEEEASRKVLLVERGVTRSNAKYVGLNQTEFLEAVITTRVRKAQKARLLRSPAQIRGSFLLRLGIPPSPKVFFTGKRGNTSRPNSRPTSPSLSRVKNEMQQLPGTRFVPPHKRLREEP